MGFNYDGLKEFQRSLTIVERELDDIGVEMLEKGAEVVKKAHHDEIVSLGLVGETGKLKDSITVTVKRNNYGDRYALIYPTGTHHVPKTGKKVTNSDVGFIHEFGAPGRNIPAKEWMRNANEKSADATVEAMQNVLDAHLDKIDL